MPTPTIVTGDAVITADGQSFRQSGPGPQSLEVNGSGNTLTLIRAAPNALCGLVVGLSGLYLPFKGGTLVPSLEVGPVFVPSSGAGQIALPFSMPSGLPAGTEGLSATLLTK